MDPRELPEPRLKRRPRSYCECHGEDLNAHIDAIVAKAPPLTEEKKAKLAAIIRSVR